MGNLLSPLFEACLAMDDKSGPDTVQLSRDQALELLKVLDNTRYVLETFVGQAQIGETDRQRERRSWWAQHCFPARRRIIAKYIFIITATLQAVNLLVVSVIDVWPRRDNQSVMVGTGITMILLQLFNLFFIIMVSVRLVRQLYKHKVSILLLGQSYLATLLLFAGLYTLTYRLEPKSWKFIQEDLEQDPILVIDLYSKFLFFSVSTATLCGSDNVLPKDWYNCIFTATQMLTSFVYFASILGQTLSQDTQYWLGVGSSDPHQHTSSPSSGDRRDIAATCMSGVTTARVWRNYGSTTPTPTPTPAPTPVGVRDGEVAVGVERERNGSASRAGSRQQHTVVVDIEPERSHSINSLPYPS